MQLGSVNVLKVCTVGCFEVIVVLFYKLYSIIRRCFVLLVLRDSEMSKNDLGQIYNTFRDTSMANPNFYLHLKRLHDMGD